MRLEGHLRFVDLGTGQWVIETREGKRHPLVGDVPEGLRDARVIVEGRPVEVLGFGVAGDGAIEVSTVRRG